MKNLNPTTFAISLALVAGLSFFAGTKYQLSKTVNRFQTAIGTRQQQTGMGQGFNQGSTQGSNDRNRMMGGMRQNIGEIINVDDKSVTIKLIDGSSRIILVNDKTTVSKEAEASKFDLKVGISVAVFGTDNSDGSVTATSVNLNPSFRNQVSPTPTK